MILPECLKICGQRIAGWHIDNIIDDDDFEVYGVLQGTKEDDFVYLDDFIKSDHIGSGWNQLGDLSKYSTKDAALEYIRNDHPKYVNIIFSPFFINGYFFSKPCCLTNSL